ncbi:MAG: FAD-dependent oxidoreductase, partial [Bacteroidota bacterium]
NLYRNRECNPLIFDSILLEKVEAEPNITLLLNTAMYEIKKRDEKTISTLKAFCSQNSTSYYIHAPLFCDASGDGILAFQAGAAFRIGAESKKEFGEKFAPNVKDYGELLGHSMYFYSKRADKPVKYIPPAFALKDIREIPRYKVLSQTDFGCRLWWIEYGGRTDTIHHTEEIKWELWKVIYGIWDYIKNSGEFEDVENLTLEWVATIPGKRESRRFEGLHMLTQQDIITQKQHDDAVAFGGWAIDLHPADGIYSDKPGCNQWHSKGIYGIPYRCYVSRDIENLWFAGRIISASHVAFGSSRVMATCAHGAQAVATAAVLCAENNLLPADILAKPLIHELQQRLSINGQSIPNMAIEPKQNLLSQAKITASSTMLLEELPFNGDWTSLKQGTGQLLPLTANVPLKIKVQLRAKQATSLQVELQTSQRIGNYTPDHKLETLIIDVKAGEQWVTLSFNQTVVVDQYVFVLFMKNELIEIRNSEVRITGLVSVYNKVNKAVSNLGKQTPDANIGVDAFAFWTPARRPEGQNIAMHFETPLAIFQPDFIRNGFVRPYLRTNAWAASLDDAQPTLTFEWEQEQEIKELKLFFDNDYDHPLESTLQGHPEDVIPFCVQNYQLILEKKAKILTSQDEKQMAGNKHVVNVTPTYNEQEDNFNNDSQILFEQKGNHQTINTIQLKNPLKVKRLLLRFEHPSANTPTAVFEVVIR